MIIGITGCIGSGKSYVNKIISDLGYKTFNSDLFVLQAYNDEKILLELNQKFDCITNGTFDKKKLKSHLNDNNLKELNNIIHPYVIDQIKQLKRQYKNEKIFIEIPLLFEENLEYLCDYTITVFAKEETRLNRLYNRDKNNYELMRNLEKKQLSSEEKQKKASFTINNDFDDNNIIKEINNIIDKLK